MNKDTETRGKMTDQENDAEYFESELQTSKIEFERARIRLSEAEAREKKHKSKAKRLSEVWQIAYRANDQKSVINAYREIAKHKLQQKIDDKKRSKNKFLIEEAEKLENDLDYCVDMIANYEFQCIIARNKEIDEALERDSTELTKNAVISDDDIVTKYDVFHKIDSVYKIHSNVSY
ncbi:hypothetical protein OAT93_01525 [bacterium]|nr:hypothetical protein [bacterium]